MNKVDTKHRNRRYPWEKWFSQRTFTLYQDKDFINPVAMVQAIRNKAPKFGVKVSITSSPRGDAITVLVKEKV